ncbi:Sugar efflux transporter B [Avibacterium paragallinarum]|uniref:Sugar efflux transporter B n=1 Tax=Avibacterium paragallinarum TaxID=728 RepID=A0A380X575_AVIPA|nr:Sugar efflux transporter B [Avibacterium paragallinarum]
MVLGLPLPLGRMIGQWLGWRITFGVIGIVAFVVLIFLYKLLPHLVSKNAGTLKSVPILFQRPLLVGLFVLTAIVISAHFIAYSYIEPFMIQEVNISASETTLILLLFGCAGMIASILFSRFYRLGPAKFLLFAMLLLTYSLFSLWLLKKKFSFYLSTRINLGNWYCWNWFEFANSYFTACSRCYRCCYGHFFWYL